MTETVAAQTSVAASAKKAGGKTKTTAGTKKAAAVPSKVKSHPPTGEMVNAAIATLKDKKGSSLQAIKKYIAGTYKVDLKKQSIFIRKYLKSAVEKKTIVQAKGTGASGRFKLAGEGEKKVVKSLVKKPTAKKPAVQKKPVAVAKKATGEKKVAAKKPPVKKTAAKTTKPKSPSKAKKTGKAPAAKNPKTPKPKVTKAKPAKK